MVPNGHRTAELRSIAMHALIAERLDDQVLSMAQERVEQWIRDGGPVPPRWAHGWRELLAQPVPEIAETLVEDGEWMRDLRQNTPFAGVLTPEDRWKIIREVR